MSDLLARLRIRPAGAGFLVAAYTALVAALTGLAIALRWPEVLLIIAVAPITYAALIYPRRIYLLMVALLAPCAVLAISDAGPGSGISIATSLALVASVGLLSEVIHRLAVSQGRLKANLASLARFPAENPDPVLRITPDGAILYANLPAQGMLRGLDGGEARAPAAWTTPLSQALASGERREVECPAGQRLFACLFVPIPASGYVNVYCRDVTESRRAQAALQQAEQQLRRRNEHLSALSDTTLALINHLDTAGVLENIVKYAMQLLEAPEGYLYMLDAGGQRMVAAVGIGQARQFLGQALQRGVGLAGQVWLTGEPILVTNYDAYPNRLQNIAPGLFHSLAALPLRSGEQVIGILGIGFHEVDRTLSDDDLQTLTRFAQVAAVAIDNARLYAVAQQELAERQRTETELTAQRDFAVQVMNTMGQGLTVTDGHGRFEFVNPAYAAMLGRQPQELVGQTPRDLTHPADQAVLDQARADRAAGKMSSYETRLLRADGTVVYAFITSVPRWRSGQVDGAIAVITDLTERMEMEEALRDNEAAIRGLYAIVSDHTLTFSRKVQAMLDMGRQRFGMENGVLSRVDGGRIEVLEARSASSAFRPGTILKLDATYCREAIDSSNPVSFEHAGASDWRRHPGYLASRLEAYLGVRVTVKGRVHGTLHFSSAAPRPAPFRSIDREFARLMAQWIGSEIEREQYVAQLRDSAAEIARKNADLAVARDQALEASRLKSEFLATVSHEIRTPLNVIIGMTELLQGTPLAPDQREFAGTTLSSAQSLLSVINDILDFSRIEAGRMILERVAFEPGQLIQEMCAALEAGARDKGLTLTARLAPDLPAQAVGDPARLRQVLANLIGNAIKFTHAGAIQVNAALAHDPPETGALRVTVSDTGIGVPAAVLDRLFQPFTQADGSTTRKYGGTGLGLALCKGLVELMGGRIGAESQPGRGSIFWFIVPLERVDGATR